MKANWVLIKDVDFIPFGFWRGADEEENALKRKRKQNTRDGGVKSANGSRNRAKKRPRLEHGDGNLADNQHHLEDDQGEIDGDEEEDLDPNENDLPDALLFGGDEVKDSDEEDELLALFSETMEDGEHDQENRLDDRNDLDLNIDLGLDLDLEKGEQQTAGTALPEGMDTVPASSHVMPAAAASSSEMPVQPVYHTAARSDKPSEEIRREGAPRVKMHKDFSVDLITGDLRYNIKSKSFYAECKLHEQCRATRTSQAPARPSDRNRGQGRPLGLLAAWLDIAAQCVSPADHKSRIVEISRADREKARIELKGISGSQDLFTHERARRDEEPEEPKFIQ